MATQAQLARLESAIESLVSAELPCPCESCAQQLDALTSRVVDAIPSPANGLLPTLLGDAGLRVDADGWQLNRSVSSFPPGLTRLLHCGLDALAVRDTLAYSHQTAEAQPDFWVGFIGSIKTAAQQLPQICARIKTDEDSQVMGKHGAGRSDHPQDWPDAWNQGESVSKSMLAMCLTGCGGKRWKVDRHPAIWRGDNQSGTIFLQPIHGPDIKQVQQWLLWCASEKTLKDLNDRIRLLKARRHKKSM